MQDSINLKLIIKAIKRKQYHKYVLEVNYYPVAVEVNPFSTTN